jgi:hypothetical protein
MGKMGDTWRGVETIPKIGETDQGVTVTPLSYLGAYLVDRGVPGGDPAPLLRAITLPVNQVLKIPALRSGIG